MKSSLFLISFIFIVFIGKAQEITNRFSESGYALVEGSKAKMIGNINDAINYFKIALAADPKCAAAAYEISSIYSVTGNYSEAFKFIEIAYNIDKLNFWYVIAYTDILKNLQYYDKAIEILKYSIKIFPKEERNFRFELAQLYFLNKKFKKAIKEYNVIERKYGATDISVLGKIDIYKELKDNKKIYQAFKDFLTDQPDNVPVLILFSESLAQMENYNLAINYYQKVLGIDPGNIYAITNLTDLYGKIGDKENAYKYLSEAFLSESISIQKKLQTITYILNDQTRVTEDKEFLENLLNSLLNIHPDNFELLVIAYDFYYKTQQYEHSFGLIKSLIQTKPDNYIFWVQALYTAHILADNEEVIRIGHDALKIFPNKDDIRVFIGLAYYESERIREAYIVLKETENRFNEPELLKQKNLLLAEASYKLGYIEESFSFFEIILESDPDNIPVKNNYSYYLSLERMNLERAKKLSYETISTEPENSTYLDTYGWVLFQMGDYAEAEEFLKKAVENATEPSNELIQHLIDVLIINNKFEEAEIFKKQIKNE